MFIMKGSTEEQKGEIFNSANESSYTRLPVTYPIAPRAFRVQECLKDLMGLFPTCKAITWKTELMQM